ncbi:MAG: cell envelope integrity protein CreD, partial [Bacteroidia bacterium]|nr:cell envelope integrity protein CreD [Bacteroidia bacterium]
MNTQSLEPENRNKFGLWLKTSITARMLMVGFLTIILLIPLSFIESLITERSFRQNDVVAEINDKWGNDVIVYGPILKLPYKHYTEIKTLNEKTNTYIKEIQTTIKYSYIFPTTLDAVSDVNSKTLHRGNFESAVYTTQMQFSGIFSKPNLTARDIKDEDIVWEKASILVRTSNLKGIKNEVYFKIDNRKYAFQTNYINNKNYLDELESSFLKPSDVPKEKDISFSFNIDYNGSKLIQVIPVGKTTTMQMKSNWPDPSFTGNFLPNDETKEISKDGFKADWKVLHINRPFSQQYI